MSFFRNTRFTNGTRCYSDSDSDNEVKLNEQEILFINSIEETIKKSYELIEKDLKKYDEYREKILLIHQKMKEIIDKLKIKVNEIKIGNIELSSLMIQKLNKSKDNLNELNKLCNNIYNKNE